MRIATLDELWIVIDPGPVSGAEDICFRGTLADSAALFQHGLRVDQNPTLYRDEARARQDADCRLLAQDVARLIRSGYRVPSGDVVRVTLHDENGAIVWKGDVR